MEYVFYSIDFQLLPVKELFDLFVEGILVFNMRNRKSFLLIRVFQTFIYKYDLIKHSRLLTLTWL